MQDEGLDAGVLAVVGAELPVRLLVLDDDAQVVGRVLAVVALVGLHHRREFDLPRLGLGLVAAAEHARERGRERDDQRADDRDHDEEFDQRESGGPAGSALRRSVHRVSFRRSSR
ncbi:MAG: hypothetical protein O3B85_12270 [Planctomycetota bacterium]|nr:hypothetical protein [Planctomycetota bacterium]